MTLKPSKIEPKCDPRIPKYTEFDAGLESEVKIISLWVKMPCLVNFGSFFELFWEAIF